LYGKGYFRSEIYVLFGQGRRTKDSELSWYNSAMSEDPTKEKPLPIFQIDMPGIDEAPDSNCMQASVEMVLKDIEGDDAPSLEELNEASHKREGMGTWPGWIASWLKDRGHEVEVLSNVDWKRFVKEGEEYLGSAEFKEKHTTEDGNGDDLVYAPGNMDNKQRQLPGL